MIRAGDSIENPVTGERLSEAGIPTQRALLTGGTCESSAFVRMGWTTTAIALPNVNYHNQSEETAHFVCEIRPALQFESLIETMFSLAADGKTNRKGMPNPLRLAVIANAHFDTVQLPFPPAFLQRFGLALGAPVGKALGYGPVYVPAAGVPVTAAA